MIHAPLICSIFGVQAITVWKWVLYAEKNPNPILVNHERIHLDQIKRDGVFHFYARYLREYLRLRCKRIPHWVAYQNISYEQEAYNNQHNLDYQVRAQDGLA